MSNDASALLPAPIGPKWTFAGILMGCVAYNILAVWLADADAAIPEWLGVLMVGAWAFEPMLLAIWTALAPGAFATRIPLAVPALLILIAAPSAVANDELDFERGEFILTCTAGLLMLLVSATIVLLLRRFLGWRLEHFAELHLAPPRLQFSITYLIILTTLWAAALALIGRVSFSEPDPNPFLGPDFFLYLISIGAATLFAVLSPMVAIPLIILSSAFSKTSLVSAACVWFIVTALVLLVWIGVGEAEGHEAFEMLNVCLLTQIGAGLAGAFAAVPVRATGLRLVYLTRPQGEPLALDHEHIV